MVCLQDGCLALVLHGNVVIEPIIAQVGMPLDCLSMMSALQLCSLCLFCGDMKWACLCSLCIHIILFAGADSCLVSAIQNAIGELPAEWL